MKSSENLYFQGEQKVTQPAITCSKLTIETVEQRCEIRLKLIIKTPKRSHWRRFGVFIVNSEHISHLCSSVSVVNFEQVNAELGIHNSRNQIWKQYLSIRVCVRSFNSICESNYRISSNKHSQHLCNFEALWCGA